MKKGRLTNGFTDKNIASNPLSLHSLLKNYLESASIPKSHKEILRSQHQIENEDADENQFTGLIKGIRMRASRNQMMRKNSLEPVEAEREQGQSGDRKEEEGERKGEEGERRGRGQRSVLPRSKKVFVARNKVSVKSKLTDHKVVKTYFRNQLISLYQLLNRREDYFLHLKGKRSDSLHPMKSTEVEEALGRLLEARGRDRGRVKFNHLTNEQLRSLKYKPKPMPTVNLKKGKVKNGDYIQVQSGQEEQEQGNEQGTDMATWKKRNGCGFSQKVYIVKGGYHQLRRTLAEKGWFQNEDVYSRFFDLKWTTQTCDIDFATVRPGQVVNHFNNNHHLTSKYGLARKLKTLIVQYGVDIDCFYPRCFDLADQADFQNFVENFKFSFAESAAKRFLVDKERYKGRELKVRTLVDILRRRLVPMAELVSAINNGLFTLITPEEWEIITETIEWDDAIKKEKSQKLRDAQQLPVPEGQDYETAAFEILHKELQGLLERLGAADPQLQMNGFRNVWIAKPNFLSRGRGIRCLNNLYDIADYCLGKECQFVIQKYIENPLLINSRKFDIRQWVLIQDFNPPVIWFYQECYLRFCCDDYSLDDISNRFVHLTNNSVQKHNKKAVIEESMWEMKDFVKHIGEEEWAVLQQKMKSIVVWSIKSCEGSVTGKKGFFELVGYDFMIDDRLNPWLIEVNMSPSMDHSTPVTKKLVKMVQRDTANLITAPPKKKEKHAGLFTCIYKSEEDLHKYPHYKL